MSELSAFTGSEGYGACDYIPKLRRDPVKRSRRKRRSNGMNELSRLRGSEWMKFVTTQWWNRRMPVKAMAMPY